MMAFKVLPRTDLAPTAKKLWAGFRELGAQLIDRSNVTLGQAERAVNYWPLFLVGSTVVAIVVFLVLWLFNAMAVAVASSSRLLSWLLIVPAAFVAALGVVTLAWSAFRIRRPGRQDRAVALSSLASAPTIAAAMLVATGATALVSSGRAAPPDLLEILGVYAWHVLDSIPLVHVEELFGWSRPVDGESSMTAIVALALKATVVLPLIQIVLAGYWWARQKIIRLYDSYGSEASRSMESIALQQMALLIVVVLVTWLVWPREPVVFRWFTATIPGPVPIRLPEWIDPAGWVRFALTGRGIAEVLGVVAAVVVVCYLGLLVAAFGVLLIEATGSLADTSLRVLEVLLFLVVVPFVWAIALGVLIRVRWARAVPALPSGEPIWSVLETNMWLVANDVPALQIPRTLGWVRPHVVSGPFAGATTVIFYGVGVTLLLAIPILLGLMVHRLAPEKAAHRPISAVRGFVEWLDILRDEFADAEHRGEEIRPFTATDRELRRHLHDLESQADIVRQVFGESAIAATAATALSTAWRRYQGLRRRRATVTVDDHDRFGAEWDRLREEFVITAKNEMSTALPPSG